MSDTIVITGAGGQVGSFLAGEATRQGRQVVALTSADWNIADPVAGQRFATDERLAGAVVVNCAAYTNVDACETDEAGAYAVNATGAANVAAACERAGARLIHISTDYVFSGIFDGAPRPYEPSDETGPLGVYGESKLAGEEAVLSTLPGATVVRTAWVYTGGSGNDFTALMARKARAGESVNVVDDQIGSPTFTGDLVTALLHIADHGVTAPVVHAANDGPASRFEQARAAFAAVGADPDLVHPVSTAEYPRPARRPGWSALGGAQSAAAGLPPLRPWQEALDQAVAGS